MYDWVSPTFNSKTSFSFPGDLAGQGLRVDIPDLLHVDDLLF